jgi:hypothetical protein
MTPSFNPPGKRPTKLQALLLLLLLLLTALGCGGAAASADQTQLDPPNTIPPDAIDAPPVPIPPAGNWECLAGNEEPVRIPNNQDGVLFSVRVLDSVTGASIPGLSVEICETADPDCLQPLVPLPTEPALLVVAGTGDSGVGVTASLHYETQVFLRFSAPEYVSIEYHPGEGLMRPHVIEAEWAEHPSDELSFLPAAPLLMPRLTELARQSSSLTTARAPSLGQLRVFDCDGAPAAQVPLTLSPPGGSDAAPGDSALRSWTPGVGFAALPQSFHTAEGGLAHYASTSEGPLQVSARIGSEPFGMAQIDLRSSHLIVRELHPGE